MNRSTAQAPARSNYDVVIVGGAMYGASVSWFLADNPDFDGSILVVEREPTYTACSTTHTNSCMRQQFSREINVRTSQFAADFVKNLQRYMGDDPRVPNLPIQSYGYMYLADNEPFAEVLRASQQVQAACGAGTRYLTAEEIGRDYPFITSKISSAATTISSTKVISTTARYSTGGAVRARKKASSTSATRSSRWRSMRAAPGSRASR